MSSNPISVKNLKALLNDFDDDGMVHVVVGTRGDINLVSLPMGEMDRRRAFGVPLILKQDVVYTFDAEDEADPQ